MLINFCAMNELRINKTFYPHTPQHKFTFENTKEQKSIIDYIITNRNTKILDVSVLTSANTDTNHNLVLAKIRKTTLNTKTKLKGKQTTTEKLNIELLGDESTIKPVPKTTREKNNGKQNSRNRQRRDGMAKDQNKHQRSNRRKPLAKKNATLAEDGVTLPGSRKK
ncbi:hypothetical protein M0804_006982 [Polistes exclamans]|nr:hypothetical protein M0804_006982 [Polistes exclamans]